MAAKPLDPSAQGKTTEPLRFHYGFRDVALYALGVGAGGKELGFVYEGLDGKGAKVLPTYAVIPTYEACKALLGEVRQWDDGFLTCTIER